MSSIANEQVEAYAEAHTTPPAELLARLAEETHATMSSPQMLTGRVEGRLLELLVHALCPTRARARHVHGLLRLSRWLRHSRRTAHRHVRQRAEARRGRGPPLRRARTVTRSRSISAPPWRRSAVCEGEFDLVFIDADKANYDNYYEAVPSLSLRARPDRDRQHLWSGRVVDPQDDDTRAIAALNDKLAADERVVCVQLTVRDGVTLVRRRS